MTRRGRFAKFNINQDQIFKESNALFPTFYNYYCQYKSGLLHPAQFVALYLILVAKHRRSTLWQGSYFHWLSALKPDEFIEFWGKTQLRGIPLKVNQVLINWYLGNYELTLCHHIPSAEEMLMIQASGKRYITLFILQNEWNQNIIHGREHFSFTMHDLIHAHEFFYNQSIKEQQICFYNKLKSQYSVIKSLSNHQDYQASLDYLISDMNSHPQHLKNYFWGLLKRFQITHYNPDF